MGTAARLLVIVQRGRLGVYETLKTRFEPDGGAALVQVPHLKPVNEYPQGRGGGPYGIRKSPIS